MGLSDEEMPPLAPTEMAGRERRLARFSTMLAATMLHPQGCSDVSSIMSTGVHASTLLRAGGPSAVRNSRQARCGQRQRI
eukprot:5183616-Alexandrium_andersonii.AAC.1